MFIIWETFEVIFHLYFNIFKLSFSFLLCMGYLKQGFLHGIPIGLCSSVLTTVLIFQNQFRKIESAIKIELLRKSKEFKS